MSGERVYTPPGRRGSGSGSGADGSGTDGGNNGGQQIIVQRVMKETAGSVVYPMLTRTNYTDWALVMRVNLQAQGLWSAIEPGYAEYQEDRMALSAILRAVPPEMLSTLAVKDTAKEAWESVKTMRVGVARVREAKAQTLRNEFELIRMKESESVDDFSMRLNAIVNNLRMLGDPLEEEKVVQKFLRVVPSRFVQVAIAIEQLLDLKTLSIEEVTGRLRTVEERYRPGDNDGAVDGGRLLLTEEQWLERRRNRKKNGDTFDKSKVRCYNCQEYGHYSWEKKCHETKKNHQAHLVVADADDEPTLL